MKAKIIYFLLGIVAGLLIFSVVNKYYFKTESTYIKLKEDFYLSNGGMLKKGTLLKKTNSASYEFSRYELLLNYKSTEGFEIIKYEKANYETPYWLFRYENDSK